MRLLSSSTAAKWRTMRPQLRIRGAASERNVVIYGGNSVTTSGSLTPKHRPCNASGARESSYVEQTVQIGSNIPLKILSSSI